MKKEVTTEAAASISIYLASSCKGNPGPGGWAAVIAAGARSLEISGCSTDTTTDNRLLLMGAIEALVQASETRFVDLYATSKYLVEGANRWLSQWQANGWLSSTGRPVENKQLWQELARLLRINPHARIRLAPKDASPLCAQAKQLARQKADSARFSPVTH